MAAAAREDFLPLLRLYYALSLIDPQLNKPAYLPDLYDLAPAMSRTLQRGGFAILSGLTADQAPGIEAERELDEFRGESHPVVCGRSRPILRPNLEACQRGEPGGQKFNEEE